MQALLVSALLCLSPLSSAWDEVPLSGDSASKTGVVPELPKADVVAAEDWYGLVSLPVTELKRAGASVRAAFFVDEERDPRAETKVQIDRAPLTLRLVISPEDFAPLIGQTVRIETTAQDGVTIGEPRLERYHRSPTRKLRGKANGPLGPDSLQSGALGFDALTEHMHTAFPLISVVEGGPADRAGMQAGDLGDRSRGSEPRAFEPRSWLEVV